MRLTISISILLFAINIHCQNLEKRLFNSISVSVNNSHTSEVDLSKNYGYGIGFEHILLENRKVNIITGLEFNHTSQFFESLYNGHFSILYDVTYKMNYFSIPIGLRLNLLNSQIFAINFGGFADFSFMSKFIGRSIQYNYSQAGTNLFSSETEFEDDIIEDIFGLFIGINVQIPLMKNWLVIKPEYKNGLNLIRDYMDSVDNNYFRIAIGYRYK